ncbi:hypothetical protein BC628DRAFT_809648 [Trametes gibbosa]|nr:hypothetical protein BC628DRAFT_809648 [Trametes gibbosa]
MPFLLGFGINSGDRCQGTRRHPDPSISMAAPTTTLTPLPNLIIRLVSLGSALSAPETVCSFPSLLLFTIYCLHGDIRTHNVPGIRLVNGMEPTAGGCIDKQKRCFSICRELMMHIDAPKQKLHISPYSEAPVSLLFRGRRGKRPYQSLSQHQTIPEQSHFNPESPTSEFA